MPRHRLSVVQHLIHEPMSNSTRPAMWVDLQSWPTTGYIWALSLLHAELAFQCSFSSCLLSIDCDVLSLLSSSSRLAAGGESPFYTPRNLSLYCKRVDGPLQKSYSPGLKPKATREGLTQNVTKSETERSMSRRPRRTKIEPFGVMFCM